MTATSVPNSMTGEKHPKRKVICFECRVEHSVSRASLSSLCPACSCYIDLRDVIIRDRVQERIRTRGDVIVEKKGILAASSITCGDISIAGEVQGSVYASGTIHFRNGGKVRGEVRCTRLLVDKKCKIQFLQTVHAETAEILGDVAGKFLVANRLVLGPKTKLNGSVEAKSVTMPPGAVVNGPLVINPNPAVNLHAPTSAELFGPGPSRGTKTATTVLATPRAEATQNLRPMVESRPTQSIRPLPPAPPRDFLPAQIPVVSRPVARLNLLPIAPAAIPVASTPLPPPLPLSAAAPAAASFEESDLVAAGFLTPFNQSLSDEPEEIFTQSLALEALPEIGIGQLLGVPPEVVPKTTAVEEVAALVESAPAPEAELPTLSSLQPRIVSLAELIQSVLHKENTQDGKDENAVSDAAGENTHYGS